MLRVQTRDVLFKLVFPVTVVTITILISVTRTNFWLMESGRFTSFGNVRHFSNHHGSQSTTTNRHKKILYVQAQDEEYSTNVNSFREKAIRGHRNSSLEVRHIAFLKVHKCASSTITNILNRFGFKRNLTFVLPIKGNYIEFDLQGRSIAVIPPPINSDYDILANHVHFFKKDAFARLMPSDAVYLAIVREPFLRMQSAFNYYRNVINYPILRKIQDYNPFETYLAEPDRFETLWNAASVTNNKMARDFGFSLEDFRNVTMFKTYLEEIDKTFHLVMVRELFDESLVLMRRLLNWSLKDILFLKLNSHSYQPITVSNISKEIKPFLALDYILHNHFSLKLKEKIVSAGQDFVEEVSYFRSINNKTAEFCKSSEKTKNMLVVGNYWHGNFTISSKDCALMKKEELQFLKLKRNIQIAQVKRYGADLTRFL